MKKTLLLIVCVLCLVLCACTPHKSEGAESTPAPTEPRPTPGMTVIAPTGTPGEYIDVVDPTDGPVIVPVDTPVPTPEVTGGSTPAPTPGGTPSPTPAGTPNPTTVDTPAPTPDAPTDSTGSGIDLPYIPVRPL